MALPLVGIEFIASNADDFIDIFNKIVGNVAIAGDQIQRFTDILNPFDSSVKTMSGGMNDAANSITNFDWVMHTMSNFVANVATDAFRSLTSAIAAVPQEAYAAVSAMQDMEITLETLVAGDFIANDSTIEMTEALASAVPVVDTLMLKLEELAVASPFQYQQILSVFQMNKSFGMAAEMAFETTRAITNLASTMKGVPGITQRLSYNFSQMALTGKIAGRDLRDLRMAGLDLEKVFQKQLGKTVKEVNAELAAGTMIFDDVSKAFVAYVDKYIGPAAERASRTLGGLKSTFADIAFFAYGNMFKQAGDELASGLGVILDTVLKFLRSDTFKEIGVAFGVLVKMIMDFALVMFQPIIDAADNFDKSMSGRVEKMFDWGLGLIEAFADGIIAGLGYLVNAMSAIGSLLANWLMPGSPPKIVPNIDKWGLDTAREWLKGFTEADYSVLDEMQAPLKQVLSTLMSMGGLGAGMDEQIFADISKSMIAALSGQKDFGSVISQVQKASGPFGEDMAKLVTLQFDYAKATEEAAKAEERLIAAQKAEYEATNKVYSSVKEYNDMLRSGASKKALKDKMAQVNASRKEQIATRENRNEAGKQYQTVQENMQAIQKQISMQQKLIDTMLELTNAYNSAQKAREDAAKAGGGGGKAGAGQPTIPTTPAPDFGTSELQQKLNALKDKLEAKVEEMKLRIVEKFKKMKDDILFEWYFLKEKILAVWDGIKTVLSGEIVSEEQVGRIAEAFGFDKDIVTQFLGNINDMKGAVENLFSGDAVTEEQATGIAELFGLDPQSTVDFFAKVEEVKTKVSEFIEGIKVMFAPIIATLVPTLIKIFSMIWAVLQTLFPQIKSFIGVSEEGGFSFEKLGQTIADIITRAGNAITAFIAIIGFLISTFLWLTSEMQAFMAFSQAMWVTLSQIFLGFITGLNDIVLLGWDLIKQGFETGFALIKDLFTTGGENWNTILTGHFDTIKKIFSDFVEKFREKWEEVFKKVEEAWGKFEEFNVKAQEQFDSFMSYFDTLKTNFQANIDAITKKVTEITDAFQTFWDWLSGLTWPSINIGLPDVAGWVSSATSALEGLGGDIANAFSGGTSTSGKGDTTDDNGKARGGAVHSNKPYIVGEEGPEWFIPPNSGRIIPNNMPLPAKYLGSSSMTEVNNSVSVSFGAVTITNAQEGAMFEQRVERAVRKALGG